MFMWRQLSRCVITTGRYLACSAEAIHTEKCLAKIWEERYFQNSRKKEFKQVLERDDGVLGFSETNIPLEDREFDRKLANGHAELLFWKKCRIIQTKSVILMFVTN